MIDPITVEVIRAAMNAAAEEIERIFLHTSLPLSPKCAKPGGMRL